MWKRQLIIFLLVVTSFHHTCADDPATIVGDALEGPNVCKKIENYNVTVIVKEMVPQQVFKTVWCAQIPPRCRKSEIQLKEVERTEVLEKMRAVRYCCEGYVENGSRNKCIPHCPKECFKGTCSAPNKCKCDPGYGGPVCDITCPPNFYGKHCKKKCDCQNNAVCDPYDGKCHCKRGFRGDKCESKCTPDRYGEDCMEKCQCENGGKCNHISGECYCPDGFTGPLCTEKCNLGDSGKECRSLCKCQNGGICIEDTKQCKCSPGWTGDVCANRCQPGLYGINCTQSCECFNGGNCNHVTGECQCEPGFIGDKCLDQCPFDKYGINCTETCSCKNDAICDKATGRCICAAGWTGVECSERKCPDDMYGEDCKETCDCEKNNTELCHPHDGKCECKPGWSSASCNRPCPFFKYGKYCAFQCDCKNNGQCSPITGACFCPPGFTGEKCENTCPAGTHGQDCSERCDCKNGADCLPETGQCQCKPGWSGLRCERPCDLNTYGDSCSKTCNCQNSGSCNPVTGECYCSPGWIGESCTKKCDSFMFGQNCSFECDCERSRTLACNPVNGQCLCKTTYEEHTGVQVKYSGVRCESSCPLGYYGMECEHQCNCKNNSSCDPNSGECFCERGWMGAKCDQKCPNGYFGQNCKERCPENMPPKTTCDHVTGNFKCRPGYIGLTCEHPCSIGTYGEDCQFKCNCLNGGECSHIDGKCHCFPGWTGDSCEMPCSNTTWGINCIHQCKCINNGQCRKTDGTCVCEAGFMGNKCEEICPEGFYGLNCLSVCDCTRRPNSVCHPAVGCVCRTGFKGENCDVSLTEELKSNETYNERTEDPTTSLSPNVSFSTQSPSPTEIFKFTTLQSNDNKGSGVDVKPTEEVFTFISLVPTSPVHTSTAMHSEQQPVTQSYEHNTTNEQHSTRGDEFFTENSGNAGNSNFPSYLNDSNTSFKQTDSYSAAPTKGYSTVTDSNVGIATEKTIESNNVSEGDADNKKTTSESISGDQETKNTIESNVTTTPLESDSEFSKTHEGPSTSKDPSVVTTPEPLSIATENSQYQPTISKGETDLNSTDISDVTFTTESYIGLNSTSALHTTDASGKSDFTDHEVVSSEDLESDLSEDSFESTSDSTVDFGSNITSVKNKTRKSRFRNFFFHYLVSSIKSNASSNSSSHTNSTATAEENKADFLGVPASKAGTVWGIFLLVLFVGIVGAVAIYYRRRVSNLKKEINHVVQYMSEDRNNFDNPVYSYQQASISTDASTLLHRNGVVNNLRQTKPSNISRLNNFDSDSNSSGRAAAYSLQYDSQLMNQKNHEADMTNPNFYNCIEDHLYDEIKLKADQEEYDHLDYSRPIQPQIPHYHRTTSSSMSTTSHRDRESNQSNSKFPSFSEEACTYDAPVPHPKQLNINVPPLPMKNNTNLNLTPSPSSSTASTVTQDDNIDAIISVEKPVNKNFLETPSMLDPTNISVEKRDVSTD